MAFKEIDRRLVGKCTEDIIDIEGIKTLLDSGANVNAFDQEHEESLYEAILDDYIDRRTEQPNLANLFEVTQLFIKRGMSLNPKPEDIDWFLPKLFKFLPPEKMCVTIFKTLLEQGACTCEELDYTAAENALDLHMDMFYFFEDTQYSKADSLRYFLELIYWATAYSVKLFPEKCTDELLLISWFERERNKVELVRENRSTSIYVEDLQTHKRVEIQGWTMKY